MGESPGRKWNGFQQHDGRTFAEPWSRCCRLMGAVEEKYAKQ